MTITVRDAEISDLESVEEDIRQEDRAEWTAGTGLLFGDAARDVLMSGTYCRLAVDDAGTPLCFWGCIGGRVWLFATNAAARKAFSLHRVLSPNLRDLHDRWGTLEAWADGRNVTHHRWLHWLGFSEQGAVLAGPYSLPFKIFVKEH